MSTTEHEDLMIELTSYLIRKLKIEEDTERVRLGQLLESWFESSQVQLQRLVINARRRMWA